MSTQLKLSTRACLATLALVFGIGLGALVSSRAEASVDSWSGHTEKLTPFSQSVTAGTPALVVSAVSATSPPSGFPQGVNQNVRSMVVTSTVSTTVIFHSANSTSGASIIGVFGLLANQPLPLTEDQLGQGMRSGITNPIYVDVGSTATVTITARVRSDPN